jgi:hypothetical protein
MPLKLEEPRKGKSQYWTVRGTINGQRIDRTTKAVTRQEAEVALAALRSELDEPPPFAPHTRFSQGELLAACKMAKDLRMDVVIDPDGNIRITDRKA